MKAAHRAARKPPVKTRFRALIGDHARLTLVLRSLALAIKAAVPVGAMMRAMFAPLAQQFRALAQS